MENIQRTILSTVLNIEYIPYVCKDRVIDFLPLDIQLFSKPYMRFFAEKINETHSKGFLPDAITIAATTNIEAMGEGYVQAWFDILSAMPIEFNAFTKYYKLLQETAKKKILQGV